MNGKEVMKCRKVKAVIRYHTPNKTKEPERYFHHLLMLYYPWRNESELMAADQSYTSKFYEPNVQDVVESNRSVFEPDADAVTEALENLRNNQGNIIYSFDPINDQENSDLQIETQNLQDTLPEESFNEQSPSDLHVGSSSDSSPQVSQAISTYTQLTEISDDMLRNNVRSLNEKQRSAYNIALSWCRNTVKNLNCLKPEKVDPINLFGTGGAGAGKSHLIKAIYHTAVKTFRYGTVNPDRPTVALMAPTGVAAININGTTIHTALSIPKESGDFAPQMSDQKRTQLRLTLSELKTIVDEISMVANTTLLHIHQRLKEIFNTPNSELFARISFIAVGDLYQLPPIRRRAVFENYKNDTFNLCHPWSAFKMIELTEIMRQKDDKAFAELLNRLREGKHSDNDIAVLKQRLTTVSPGNANYPMNITHLFSTNASVDAHNNALYTLSKTNKAQIKAVDIIIGDISDELKNEMKNKIPDDPTKTMGLYSVVSIATVAKYDLTTNIDVTDGLTNGAECVIEDIDYRVENSTRPSIIWVSFPHPDIGRKQHREHAHLYNTHINKNWTPVLEVTKQFQINKKSKVKVLRRQFPLRPAAAKTIHRCQGDTLNETVVDFPKSTREHMHYVGLGRVRNSSALHILNLNENVIKVSEKVKTEMSRLRREASLMPLAVLPPTEIPLTKTILFQNVRSLHLHIDGMCEVIITLKKLI